MPEHFLLWFFSALIGLSAIYFIYSFVLKDRAGKAKLDSIVVAENKVAYAGIITHDGGRHVNYEHIKFITLDAQTGAMEKRIIFRKGKFRIVMCVNGIVWAEISREQVAGYDIFSQEKVMDESGIKTKLNLPANDPVRIDSDIYKGIFILKSSDGTKHNFNCSEVSAAVLKKSRSIPPDYLSFSERDNSAFHFVKKENSDVGEIFSKKSSGNSHPHFNHPELLIELSREDGNVPAIVFYHVENSQKDSPFTLSLMDELGLFRWNITQESLGIKKAKDRTPAIKLAGECGNLLIFSATQIRQHKIFAVDKITGNIAWNINV